MSQDAFALLHPDVQRAISAMGWKQLRPIQSSAIREIAHTKNHLLICAATAGGKTEAAFLPIVSQLKSGPQDSIRAVYVGPLKALINDQFGRLEQLCERLEIPVHRWHGDVTAGHKQALRRNPGGILLITPESLESNFINFGLLVPALYRQLEFVVVDELHSFLGNVRGIHLLSLLSRLRTATGREPRMIGLSATLGDPEMGKHFLADGKPDSVSLIADSGVSREIRFALKAVVRPAKSKGDTVQSRRMTPKEVRAFVEAKTPRQILSAGQTPTLEEMEITDAKEVDETDELDDLADELTHYFAKSTNLVFVNSRRTAEELAVRVHDRVKQLQWPHDPFVIHHGSVSKELREEAEAALKSGVPTTAICSSTLEMGIDIGSVRAVGQIDPPWSASSLMQRLGRSGRREGEPAIMRMYVREDSPSGKSRLTDLLFPDLLRAVALTNLMRQKWLESADDQALHLSTLVHQIMSHLRQTGGMKAASLFKALVIEGPFRHIERTDFEAVLRGLAEHKIVEQLPTAEIILAPDGEYLTSAKDFYAAFKGTEMYSVKHEKNQIGELALDALPPQEQVVVLAGRRWLVEEIDSGAKTVWVSPAKGGKTPIFMGNGGELHSRVVTEMKQVLMGDEEPPFMDEAALDLLRAARNVARKVGLHQTNVLSMSGGMRWFPWAGTRCLRTLAIMAQSLDMACDTDRFSIWFPISTPMEFRELLERLKEVPITDALGQRITPKHVEKYDEFLPPYLLSRAAVRERLAVEEAKLCIAETLA